MPTVGPGRITFTGVRVPLSCSFSLGHGTAPSQGTLKFLWQPEPVPPVGDLTLECDGERVFFPVCRIGKATHRRDPSLGRVMTVQIMDRRWRWNDAQISGEYNVRKADDTFEPGSEKSPQELANLLCEAFGEAIDVTQLPNDDRPYVFWDYSTASDALDELCEQLNCRVVLRLDNRARIVRKNSGASLPAGPLRITVISQIEPPERPDILRVVGARVKRQVRIPLEAVGHDIDGKVKPIDELLQRPSGGWMNEWPDMPSISDKKFTLPGGARTSPLDLYRQSVYRWYRVKDEGIKIPDLNKSDPDIGEEVKRWQILPLGSSLVEEYADSEGRKHPLPAYVIGDWWGYLTEEDIEKNHVNERVRVSFSIDAERGIVQFSEPLYRIAEGRDSLEPAKLFLCVAVEVKHPETRAPERYVKDLRLSRSSTGERAHALRREDIQLNYRAEYTEDDEVSGNVDNVTEADKLADFYLSTAVQEYLTYPADTAPYVGIQRIDPDGAIEQVTWSVVMGQGASTEASRGFEHNLNVPSYKQAQEMRNRRTVEHLAKLAVAEDKRKLKKG